jgi:hypothetical protein
MRKIVLITGILSCLAFSCRHKPVSVHKAASGTSNNAWLGKWERHEWQNGGELTISKIVKGSAMFSLEINGGGATGEIEGKAHIVSDSAVYISHDGYDSCRMVFLLNKTRSAISISESRCIAGVGAGFEGNYVRFKSKEDLSADDSDKNQTLVSLQILTRQEDKMFRKLVGGYYQTYVTNTQQTDDDVKDVDQLNAKVIASSVNQMRTFMEYIIMIDSSKHIWAATIDNDTVRYFTNNDLYRDKLPKTIDNWREDFKQYPVIYQSKK